MGLGQGPMTLRRPGDNRLGRQLLHQCTSAAAPSATHVAIKFIHTRRFSMEPRHDKGDTRRSARQRSRAQPRGHVTKEQANRSGGGGRAGSCRSPASAAHDTRLWDAETGRRDGTRMWAIPEWRRCPPRIRHQGTHLSISTPIWRCLRLTRKPTAWSVHWAKDAAEHNAIVLDLLRHRGAKS